MTKVELIDKKEQLRLEAEGIISAAEAEKRALSSDEDSRIAEIRAKMDGFDVKIRKLDDELKRGFRKLPENNGGGRAETRSFSLVRAIRDVSSGIPLDEVEQAVVMEGVAQMRSAGQPFSGQIVLPLREERGVIQATVAAAGVENVQTDVLGIMGALRNRMVLIRAGASYLTGLVGDISIPVYSGSNVNWAGETAAATDGAGGFTSVSMSPKRLTARLDVSKQFLLQDSNDAEALLRSDLVRAVSEKLEATILGDAAGTATRPAGIFDLINPVTVTDFADVVDLESTLEGANVYGELSYLLNPSAKAYLRVTQKASGIGFIMEKNEVNGLPAHSSNGVLADGIVLGNWADYVIAQWGGIDLTVDPLTQADRGVVRL
ncbi:MAG: phage major capsid protein, partial [Tannerella sp.]|nr:phage major capsid protein [Tannerella sp.]